MKSKNAIIDTSLFLNVADHVQSQTELHHYLTFQLGGDCPCVLTCAHPDSLERTLKLCHQWNIPFELIGGGSNLVISDMGLNHIVIRYVSQEPHIRHDRTCVWVSGATSLDHLALYCARHGLEGLNMTTGIPGTVGGAIVGNAGAFGQQVGDVLKGVTVMDASGTARECTKDELSFSYRNSSLKGQKLTVAAATFELTRASQQALLSEREEILSLRASKHPDLKREPCAGSIFRNIEPTSSAEKRQAAGWFLEQAGVKTFRVGDAYIYPKHANIIIKGPRATAQEVYELSEKMRAAVREKFGMELIKEVQFWGDFNNTNKRA